MRDPTARAPLSRERVDAIKRRHLVHEVAAHFTRLARVGTHLAGLCPLHEETIPSFYIFRETHSWYCYGCQQGGDVIDLVRRRLALSFEEALGWLDQQPLAARTAVPLNAASTRDQHLGGDAARALAARWTPAGQAALATALSVYTLALWQTPGAQRYLARRGISGEVAARCQVGYCTGTDLVEALQHRRIPLQAAWEVGLLVGAGRQPRERFAGRLVIPELRHQAIAWMTGRLVEAEEGPVAPSGPKYMSLPGARLLGGAGLLAHPPAVVAVEGPLDWLTLVQWGIPGCYLGGSGLPAEALAYLRAVETVSLAFDQDAAGQRAAQALVRALAGHVRRVRLVRLPPGVKDVAELGPRSDGLEQFQACLLAAADPRADRCPSGDLSPDAAISEAAPESAPRRS